jgi:hypothetical protein
MTLGGSNATGANANNYIIGSTQANTARLHSEPQQLVYTLAIKVYDGTTSATITSAEIPPATGCQFA